MNTSKQFGACLKRAREELGLTLSQLGDLTGYSNPYLSQIETGKRKNPPSPELIKKLADVMENVTYQGLLEQAGYEDLAKNESIRSVYEDFGDENSIVKLHKRVKALELTLDIKDFLAQKHRVFKVENLKPLYNGHLLTKQDCQRILALLEIVFPEYQTKGNKVDEVKEIHPKEKE